MITSRKLSDWADPSEVFGRLTQIPGSVLLESQSPIHDARYSIICTRPSRTITTRGGESPFDELKQMLDERKITPVPGMPFAGGVVGFFGYELRRFTEECEVHARNDLGTPDCWLGVYDAALVFDHREQAIHVSGDPEAFDALEDAAAHADGSCDDGPMTCESPTSDFTRDEYLRAVERIKEYIAAGDIYQANLAQKFTARTDLDPWALYRRLKERNPAPYAALLNTGEMQAVSSSPELFLNLDPRTREVVTKPIKGTRPRGRDPMEDRRLADELLASEKDRAENVMIVDLERNDLGRVCEVGSVRVPELVVMESHPTVHHLVSTVTGRLTAEHDAVDLLKACFPGGSITGAPKVRAMEIIDEIEPVTRGVYTGAIGYLGFDGAMNLNIAIRTAVMKDGICSFHMGGGIVADSDPEGEYRETLDKGRAFFEVLGC